MADKISLEDIADVLTVTEAAAAIRSSEWVVKQAIREQRLKAFIPGGRDVKHPGRGQGYRIHKADLEAWYFGGTK